MFTVIKFNLNGKFIQIIFLIVLAFTKKQTLQSLCNRSYKKR